MVYLWRLSTVNSLRKYAVFAVKLPKLAWSALTQFLSLKSSALHLADGALGWL